MVPKLLAAVAELLEPAERESTLGDIQERGANTRALFELLGLVLLRQFQGIASWQAWVLFATLWLPALLIARSVESIAIYFDAPWSHSYPAYPWVLIDVPILAWTTGFTLTALGRRGSIVVLSAIAAVFLLGPQGRAYGSSTHSEVLSVALFILAFIPGVHGFVRGVRYRPFPLPLTALGLALGSICTWNYVPNLTAPPLWAHWPLAAVAAYTLRQRYMEGTTHA